MARVTMQLSKATRIDGEHREAGEIVEVEGRNPRTGALEGDALYLANRQFATEVDPAEAAASKKRGAKGAEG